MLFEAVIEAMSARAADRLNISASAVSARAWAPAANAQRSAVREDAQRRGLQRLARWSLPRRLPRSPARVRSVIATAEPFDPAPVEPPVHARGAGCGVSAVFLSALLAGLAKSAPEDRHQRTPAATGAGRKRACAGTGAMLYGDLEARAMDIAVVPADDIPARFHSLTLYEEDFVIAMRAGHPFAQAATPLKLLSRDAPPRRLAPGW